MNILHDADSVVFYQVKLKPTCPDTGTSYKSEISGLAISQKTNTECADTTATILLPINLNICFECSKEPPQ